MPVSTRFVRVATALPGTDSQADCRGIGGLGIGGLTPIAPDDIGKGIIFIASDDAGFRTGAGLVVDGGSTAQ
jgi:3(or 17)beta-hydroxysteroid dehydrogenase